MKRPFRVDVKTLSGLLMLFCFGPGLATRAKAQIILSDLTTPYTQNFNSMGIPPGGVGGTAALPENWRADRLGSDTGPKEMRTLGTWAAAGTQTTQNAGNNMTSSTRSGIYNFGKPTRNDPGSEDRAIGFLSNNGSTHSGNLYAQFKNETGSALEAFELAYDVETFRNGSVTGGTRIALYYSLNGIDWTAAGDGFITLFSGADNSDGYATTPGASAHVAQRLTLAVPVADGEVFYLAWNYSNATADSPSLAYALGVDNFSIVAVPEPSVVLLLLPVGAWLMLRKRRQKGLLLRNAI